jgi:hypothetical protein
MKIFIQLIQFMVFKSVHDRMPEVLQIDVSVYQLYDLSAFVKILSRQE